MNTPQEHEIQRPMPKIYIATEELNRVLDAGLAGKTVVISLNGQPYINFQAKLRYEFMSRGYRMKYRQNGNDTIIVWAERIIR
jgi:hypothetical protein